MRAMSGTPIIQRPVSSAEHPALREFVCAHAVRPEVTSMVEPLLTDLVSDQGGIIDLWRGDRRAMVAVVTDTCENASNSAELVMLGQRARLVGPDALATMLDAAEAFVASGPRDSLSITFPPFPLAHRDMLAARGYVSARLAYVMSRPANRPAPELSAPLPEGARFVDVDPTWIEPFYRTLSASFDAVPGAYVPSLETFRTLRLSAPIPARLLVQGDRVLGFVSVELAEGGRIGNINSLGRHPDLVGGGVGAHLLAEGMRTLSAGAPVARFRLHTAATNHRSNRLCRSFGFRTVHTISSFTRAA